ncbi:caspase family protein [Actinokineospora globicatena]|uniref:Peptidase C14 caspase domain-containing protein n=1 Tax=Actinokineospora globicatena TaxID=103729 RepID=A0A9W6QV21_9PSEU|nr:caspase family protein [Actinokineospora globicatena]GLW95109.1 hypothetical protein Aglo03_59250 [Actinokineospora globicatena]
MRHALIVANDAYQDPGLRELRAPQHDAEQLAAVLGDADIGGFAVRTVRNAGVAETGEAIEEFFADRTPDELLVLYFSGHGVKDEAGDLYFATAGTKLNRLAATAVAGDFVRRLMNRTRARRVVLLLDCCYAGAFGRGVVARAGTAVALGEQFEGRGRAVITASSALEYAFEGQEVTDSGAGGPSVFTAALVEGLRTGDADRDQDGYVGLDELYEYVYERVRASTSNQTPGKWVFDLQGDLHIARRARPVTVPSELPVDLREAIDHPNRLVRLGAIEELAGMVTGGHEGLALAARLALEDLAEDDSRAVSEAAATALAMKPAPPPAAPTPKPQPARSGPTPSDPALRWRVLGGVLAGAAAITLAVLAGDRGWAEARADIDTWMWQLTAIGAVMPVVNWLLAVALVGLVVARERRRGIAIGVSFGAIVMSVAYATALAESVARGNWPLRVYGLALLAAFAAVLVHNGVRRGNGTWEAVAGTAGAVVAAVGVLFPGYRDDSHVAVLLGLGVLAVVTVITVTTRVRTGAPLARDVTFQVIAVAIAGYAVIGWYSYTAFWTTAALSLVTLPILTDRQTSVPARLGLVATVLLLEPREALLTDPMTLAVVVGAVVAVWPDRVLSPPRR